MIDDGVLAAGAGVNIQAGLLGGTGAVNGNVDNAGVLAPGLSPGHLTVSGDYTQLPTGALSVEIEGPAFDDFDALIVGGTAALAGTLEVLVADLAQPELGEVYEVVSATERTGTFAYVQAPCLAIGKRLHVVYESEGVILEVVDSGRGDADCNCAVDFADIDAFVAALSGPDSYYAQYPDCDWLNADCDGDGDVDFADIDPFVALLGGG
jgi:hypothetical protein